MVTAPTTTPPLSAADEDFVQAAVDAYTEAVQRGLYAVAAAYAAQCDRNALVAGEIAARVGDAHRAHSGIATALDTPWPVDVPFAPRRAGRQTDDRWGSVA